MGSLEPSLDLQPCPKSSTGKTSMVPAGGTYGCHTCFSGVHQPLPINLMRGFMPVFLASPQVSPAPHQPQCPGCHPVEGSSSPGSPSPSVPHTYRTSSTPGLFLLLAIGQTRPDPMFTFPSVLLWCPGCGAPFGSGPRAPSLPVSPGWSSTPGRELPPSARSSW